MTVERRCQEAMKAKSIFLRPSTRLFALSFFALFIAQPAAIKAQSKVPRIGFLTSSGQESVVGAFKQELLDLGYIDGRSLVVEYRFLVGTPDKIPSVVTELLQLKVDVLVTTIPTAIRAAKESTKTTPIVIITTQDPVASGFIDSLARPGGNVTGLTQLTRSLSGKRLELLKEVILPLSRVGVLTVAAPAADTYNARKEYEAAGSLLKIPILSLQVARGPNPDLEGAIRDAVKGKVNALVTARNNVLTPHRKKIVDLALKNRLPSMHESSDYVEAGGFIFYGANEADLFRRAAVMVDKILKGAKPADLPVEQPTKFELVINLKTAKQIGLTIPPNVLARADRVIR